MARYRVGLETRERILAATRELLGEVGLEGLTLRAITDRAEVGPGSFYNLFDSKESVIFEVVREAITAVDPDPTGSGREQLTDLVDAYVRFVVEQRTIATIYFQIAVAGGLTDEQIADRVRHSHRSRVERFADAIGRETDLDGAAATEAADVLLASLTGYAISYLLERDFDFHRHARRLAAGVTGAAGRPD